MSAASELAFKVVIPARLGSTRLPRKVIRDINGKPVVQYVWQQAMTSGAQQVVIATDSEDVAAVIRAFGGEVHMTAPSHESGTDRVNEVAQAHGWSADTVVVNLQGDEPMMPPEAIRQAAQLLVEDAGADIATLCHPIHSVADWLNPNVVKLVRDDRGRALYFSRAPIPWLRDGTSAAPKLPDGLALRHIGLYAYRAGGLARMSACPPAALERCEALEQLRALAQGMRIAVGISASPPPRGLDTEDDLRVLTELLAARDA